MIMPKIEVRLLTEIDYNQWDLLVERSEHGTIFHSSKWITTAAKNFHTDYAIIGAFDNSNLIGGCSFYIKDLFHFLRVGYTNAPLTPYGGFVLSIPTQKYTRASEQEANEIVSEILKKIQSFDLSYVNLINSPALTDIRPFKLQGWRERVYYTYILPLDGDIFSSFSRNVRRNIQKAQKIGITAKKDFNPDIFWKLSILTYAKQKMKIPFRKEYLFNFMEMLLQNNLGEMWVAETPSGDAISALFILFDAHMSHGWVSASDPAFNSTGAYSLLLYEVFKDLQNRGFKRYNLMAANTPHLSKFYSGFNPQLTPYYGVERIKGIGKIITRL